jgi:hypothetical protein
MFEIRLEKPLIPKRPPEELARRVAEYIPPRPLFPKRTDGAQRVIILKIMLQLNHKILVECNFKNASCLIIDN